MSHVDMSSAAITARLRAVSSRSDLTTSRRLKAKIDMSPRAVTLRLKQVSQMRALCLKLGEAGEALRDAPGSKG